MAHCNSCGAELLWVRTEAGKATPLDAQPTDNGNIAVVDGVAHVCYDLLDDDAGLRYTSHFATCPDAKEHRKK